MIAERKPVRSRKDRVIRTVSIVVLAVSLLAVGYIMINGLGLIDSLDFGAGAYYYADMPGFERFVNSEAYQSPTPMRVLIVLFLAWGWLMYRLWAWVDKKTKQKHP